MNTVVKVLVTVLFTVGIVSCGSDSDSPLEDRWDVSFQNPRVSGCWGFDAPPDTTARMASNGGERLLWSYDENGSLLTVVHTGVILNCCGDRSIEAFMDDDVLVIAENDQPGEEGRCWCICPFDFALEITGVPQKTVRLRLERTVDAVKTWTWTGSIVLGDGTGEIKFEDPAYPATSFTQ